MGFWSRFGKIAGKIAKIGAKAIADTAAAGKPITLGNVGVSAAKGTAAQGSRLRKGAA